MNVKFLAVMVAAGAALTGRAAEADLPGRMEKQDMRQAIAYERQKEEAAARQARTERRRGSDHARADRHAKNSADRAAPPETGDPGPKAAKPARR